MIQAKAIVPSRFSVGKFIDSYTYVVKEVIDACIPLFALTYATWDDKPEWARQFKKAPGYVSSAYWTEQKKYVWTSGGTPPHTIRARNAPALAFPSAFTPKTRPGSLKSGGGSSGGDTVFATEVFHPGTRPRRFDVQVRKKVEPTFKTLADQALRRAVAVTGHRVT